MFDGRRRSIKMITKPAVLPSDYLRPQFLVPPLQVIKCRAEVSALNITFQPENRRDSVGPGQALFHPPENSFTRGQQNWRGQVDGQRILVRRLEFVLSVLNSVGVRQSDPQI